MLKDDLVRIRHMLDASTEALSFALDKSRSDLDENRLLMHGLVRCIEIVGEAATQVRQETKDAHPQIPWADIVAMRHRLIHGYFDVDLDRVWDTITDDLPILSRQLKEIVPNSD